MVSPGRSFDYFIPQIPFVNFREFSEDISTEMIERVLRRDAEFRSISRHMYPKAKATQKELAEEARSYIAQALNFHSMAELRRGSSSALLAYYSALNFAKAELLTECPDDIYKTRINHGLSYNPGTRRSIDSDFVTVQDGVFPRLYLKRTGETLAFGTRLPIKRLLSQIPELGWEVQHLAKSSTNVGLLRHTVVWDVTDVWSLFATYNGGLLTGRTPAAKNFQRHYVEITAPSPAGRDWRDVFGMGPMNSFANMRFFQGTFTVPVFPTAASLATTIPIILEIQKRIGKSIQVSNMSSFDAEFVDSMYLSKSLLMPSSLARYCVAFYLSSLVRYRPSRLDVRASPMESWVADAFTDQVPIWMLRDALNGFERSSYRFGSMHAVRN